MICNNCGYNVVDGAHFCPRCGAGFNNPTQAKVPNPTPILVFGIISLALSPDAGAVSIILSILAFVKAKKYFAEAPFPDKKAKVGRGLAIAGLVLGILQTLSVVAVIIVVGLFGYIVQNG